MYNVAGRDISRNFLSMIHDNKGEVSEMGENVTT